MRPAADAAPSSSFFFFFFFFLCRYALYLLHCGKRVKRMSVPRTVHLSPSFPSPPLFFVARVLFDFTRKTLLDGSSSVLTSADWTEINIIGFEMIENIWAYWICVFFSITRTDIDKIKRMEFSKLDRWDIWLLLKIPLLCIKSVKRLNWKHN